MGGSGGYRVTESEISEVREEARERLRRSELDAQVNRLLQEELVGINDRDFNEANQRLDEIETAIGDQVADFDRLLLAGSVAKHTFVDGLSDTDCLVVLKAEAIGDMSPDEVRGLLKRICRQKLDTSRISTIDEGTLAVTITYKDGTQIQLLPAGESEGGQQIASPDGSTWTFIQPRAFADRLTKVNKANGGALVPTVKLAKAIMAGQIPEGLRPTGYHAEALAVQIFDGYSGPRTPRAMVQHFFEHASALVKAPSKDPTGQSAHIDSYLGAAGSTRRTELAKSLSGVADRMATATSKEDWGALFDGS